MSVKFSKALNLLQRPFEQLPEERCPDCLVADVTFPWATDVAGKFGIPRLLFHGTSCFALSVLESLIRNEPYKNLVSEFEPFHVPGLPDQIKMTILQLPSYMIEEAENERKKLMNEALKSERTSYGVIINSFYELEPAYLEHYTKVLGRKAWHIGPVSLCNKNDNDKAARGNAASIDRRVFKMVRLEETQLSPLHMFRKFIQVFSCSAKRDSKGS
ncbi:hypothetical protein CRYUN_Cryun35bG0081900 [Craigia yunnanensis]